MPYPTRETQRWATSTSSCRRRTNSKNGSSDRQLPRVRSIGVQRPRLVLAEFHREGHALAFHEFSMLPSLQVATAANHNIKSTQVLDHHDQSLPALHGCALVLHSVSKRSEPPQVIDELAHVSGL
eukprot:3794865-Amphidinium_carterae.2